MAQQFVFKGVKEIRDYTSTDGTYTFSVKNDPRGGDTWQIPQWWNRKGNNTIYNSCTVFEMADTPYVMIIPTSADTQLQVTWDGDVYNTIFSNFDAVERILFTDKTSKRVVIEYLLPAISGGAIAKRIVQAPASIGSFTVTGKGSVEVGQSTQYQSNATPDASDAVYAWTVEQSGSEVATSKAEVTAGAAASGCTVSWKQAGDYDVKCTITSNTASDSPQSDARAVTCAAAKVVGTATVSGDATPVAEQPSTYSVAVSGNNVNDLEYDWSVLDGDSTVANPTGASTSITFAKEGNYSVQCIVSSESTDDTSSDQLEVVASVAKDIGSVLVLPGTVTGSAGVAVAMNCTFDGNIVDAVYAWTVTPSTNVTIADDTAASTNFTFADAGTYDVTCTVTSATANDSPKAGTLGSFVVS